MKAVEQGVKDLLGQSVAGLSEVIDQLIHIPALKRERYRVIFLGSLPVDASHWAYGAVRDVAAELTRWGCEIMTATGPGLRQAADEGVRFADHGKHSAAVVHVEMPVEQDGRVPAAPPFDKTFLTTLHLVLTSDAVVACPGGLDTVLEVLMIWRLLQVRHLREPLFILAGEFWQGLLAWAQSALLQPGGAEPALPASAEGPASLLRILKPHHAAWQARQA